MKKIALLLLFLLASCTKTKPTKIEAWNGLYWGDSQKKVEKRLKVKLSEDDLMNICPQKYQDFCQTLEIENYTIAKLNYNIKLMFVGDRLNRVDILCQDNSIDCFNSFETILQSRYGQPNSVKNLDMMLNKEWNLAEKHITLFTNRENSTAINFFPNSTSFEIRSIELN